MFIPASCGRLRFDGGACFLEHRSTSNHVVRTRLVRALSDDSVDTAAAAVSFFRDELGIGDDSQVFIDGFFVGEGANLDFAVRNATVPPVHRGTLIFSGSRSHLQKSSGTRLLRRLGDPVLATQMLQNCGKQNGEQVEVRGTETISSGRVPSIEIDSVAGC